MNELIPITTSPGGKSVVSARELWAFLEVKSNFSTWLTRRIEEYDFKEGKDFIPKMEESRGGRPENGFVLTLNMAKELAMVERNEKGRQIRQYFIWAENKLRQLVINPPVFQLPVTYKEALQQLITKEDQREAIEQQLALAQPKVAFFDAVSVATNCIPMASAAAVLKLPGVARDLLFQGV